MIAAYVQCLVGLAAPLLGQAGAPLNVQQEQRGASTAATSQSILFVSDRDGDRDIYALDTAAASVSRALTHNSARDDFPVSSPDGSLIAYLSDARTPGGPARVWVMGADGSQARQLCASPTGPLGEWSPSWSSDSAWLVFARDDPDAAHGSGVWAVELRSGRETPVVPPVGSFIRSVQTSPAEDAVLFAQQEDDGAWRSYVAWGDGSHIRNAGRGTDVRDGRWSTSSSTYAYAEQTAQALELWIVPAGQPARRLASLPVGEPTRAQIAWSPNSKEIAVCLLPEGSLRVIDTTNGHIAELLPGSQRRLCEAQEATDRSPDRMAAYSQAWDASGDSLVFTAERNGNSDVYRWHRGDGRVDRLTSDASWEGNASWLRTASSLLQNVDLRIEQVVTCEWPTVTAYFSLIDASGAHAPGVPPGTCTVYEGVVEQRIVRPPDVKDQPGPMNIWVVIDRTGSMADVMDEVKRIAKGFCDIVRPQDRVQVATFGDRDVTPLTGLTSDLALVRTQIDGIEVGGDTNLFDAVGMTIEEAYNAVCGRKAIVLLTDGGENASRFWTNRQELMAAVEEAGTPIYAVGILGGDLDEEVMAEFAERSNGHYFPVGKDPEDMQTVFERIRTRIETQFHVIYEVKDPLLKNGGRTLMVRLRTPFGSLQDTCVYREPHARSAFDVRVRE